MSPGPPPKKDAERRRRNKTAGNDGSLSYLPADVVTLPDIPVDVPEADCDWHPIAVQLWEAQKKSGQSMWMEPSDWAMFYLMCESISRDLNPQVVGTTDDGEILRDYIPLKGASLGAYLKGFASLLVTEGDRRRLRIELERDRRAEEAQSATVTDITQNRSELFG